MSFRSTASEKPGRLAMGGSLTVDNAARIQEELIRVSRESDRIALEIEEDAVADLSFLQILCSAHRTALLEKKTFELDLSAAPGIRQLLIGAGYQLDKQRIPLADGPRIEAGGGPDE